MPSNQTIVARWETKGKGYLQLSKTEKPNGTGFWYSYTGDGCGGSMGNDVTTDEQAIAWMERPWGQSGAGPVTVHRAGRPSLKRVK